MIRSKKINFNNMA